MRKRPNAKQRDAKRLVVLVSGAGTNLQALLDACASDACGARVVAVGADRDGVAALARAGAAGVTTFTLRVQDYPARDDWDRALAAACAGFEPDLVVMAGFMKLVGADFLARFGGRGLNTPPALLPSVSPVPRGKGAPDSGPPGSGWALLLLALP